MTLLCLAGRLHAECCFPPFHAPPHPPLFPFGSDDGTVVLHTLAKGLYIRSLQREKPATTRRGQESSMGLERAATGITVSGALPVVQRFCGWLTRIRVGVLVACVCVCLAVFGCVCVCVCVRVLRAVGWDIVSWVCRVVLCR